MRTSATIASSTTKIKAEVINILFDESLFPFAGGSLCEPEDTTDVGDAIADDGPEILVATGVEVGTFILGVGVA